MAVPLFYTNFSAGLNTRSAPYLLDEGLGPLPSRDLMNVQGTVTGAITKRNGLVTFASLGSVPSSLFALESVSPTVLVAAVGTTLVSISTVGGVTSIKTGLTNGLRWEFVSAPVVGGQGPLFGMNGTDAPQRWDGVAGTTSNWTNVSGGVAVPNGKFCVYHQNQVYVSGVTASPSRLFWSAIADPTNWDPASLTGAGFMDFDPNDGQAISGVGVVGPYLIVFKPRKAWVFIDPAAPTTRRLSDSVGCVAHRSIAAGTEGTYFLSEDRGVYVTNGSKLEPISDAIQPTIDAVGTQKSQAAAGYFNGHYFLSYAGVGSGANDTVLDWDASLKSWWRHSFGSNQLVVWHPSGSAQLYSAKSTAAIVDQCFVPGATQDNGTNFTWVWRGPWQSPSFYRRRLFPTPYYRKRLKQVRLDGQGTVDFSLAKDFAGVETLIRANVLATDESIFGGVDGSVDGAADGTIFGVNESALAPPGNISRTRFYSLGVANAFSLVFSGTSNTADSIDSYLMILHDRRDGVTT